ncbi:MAG TPA: ABC transporter ATP-binding protein [Candidatus Nitrosocosmicus sp.]|nr:ABC transporter ATP-binding protein [Candidatus Nitrosocosmicus sp.]
MTDLVIETRELRKQFGDKTAVEDLSLQVHRGEVFGFLGPNGAGKTTSIKMLLGLVEPTSGSGSVLGAPIGHRATRARIGFLPEHFRFHEWLTGRELLLVHGQFLGMSTRDTKARADALLARVDLLDAAHRPVRTYSKGMMQRVGLAQALLGHPDVVFLDEPTSGLDPLGRLLVRDVIRELREHGTTVFLNSHILGEVEATCDRVTFVREGRTIRDLRLGEIDGSMEVDLRVGSLTDEARTAVARIGRVVEDGAALSADGPERLRVSISREDLLPELARALVERGIPLYEMRVARKSLETTFLEVMGEDQRPG